MNNRPARRSPVRAGAGRRAAPHASGRVYRSAPPDRTTRDGVAWLGRDAGRFVLRQRRLRHDADRFQVQPEESHRRGRRGGSCIRVVLLVKTSRSAADRFDGRGAFTRERARLAVIHHVDRALQQDVGSATPSCFRRVQSLFLEAREARLDSFMRSLLRRQPV